MIWNKVELVRWIKKQRNELCSSANPSFKFSTRIVGWRNSGGGGGKYSSLRRLNLVDFFVVDVHNGVTERNSNERIVQIELRNLPLRFGVDGLCVDRSVAFRRSENRKIRREKQLIWLLFTIQTSKWIRETERWWCWCRHLFVETRGRSFRWFSS